MVLVIMRVARFIVAAINYIELVSDCAVDILLREQCVQTIAIKDKRSVARLRAAAPFVNNFYFTFLKAANAASHKNRAIK